MASRRLEVALRSDASLPLRKLRIRSNHTSFSSGALCRSSVHFIRNWLPPLSIISRCTACLIMIQTLWTVHNHLVWSPGPSTLSLSLCLVSVIQCKHAQLRVGIPPVLFRPKFMTQGTTIDDTYSRSTDPQWSTLFHSYHGSPELHTIQAPAPVSSNPTSGHFLWPVSGSVSPLASPHGTFELLRNLSPGSMAHPNGTMQVPSGPGMMPGHHGVQRTPDINFASMNLSAGPGSRYPCAPFANPTVPQIIVSQPQLQAWRGSDFETGVLPGPPGPVVSHPSGRDVLQETTTTVVNTTTSGPARKTQKRKNQNDGNALVMGTGSAPTGNGRKRQKKNTGAPVVPAEAAAVCGVGPTLQGTNSEAQALLSLQPAVSTEQEASRATSVEHRLARAPRDSKVNATDVWYFLWAIDCEDKPEVLPMDVDEPRLNHKPDSEFVACRLCGYVSSAQFRAYFDHIFDCQM